MELSTVEYVDPRAAWPGEATHFTPWLLAHSDRLADALGIALALEAAEHPVGGFSLDLIGRDLTNDAPLIVENQLTSTDHTHLGQLLTYAAGTEASTIVWIATSFREEHRQAIDWLNRHSDEDVHFFGVRLRVVRIADSPLAPLLEVVAHPNEWQRRVRSSTRQSTSRGGGVDWARAHEAIAAVPAGHWTAIHDLAPLVGTTPAWVGRHMYDQRHLPGFHRLLDQDGRPWQYFRWPTDDDPRSQAEVLKQEGVSFDERGAALQSQRLRSEQLAALLPSSDDSDDDR